MKKGNKSKDTNPHQDTGDNQIKNLKVLIVDDLFSERLALAKYYLHNMEGIFWGKILYAENGIEAVEACRNNPDIDLILMNIQMPKMDGYEATKQIRYFNKEVIIIFHTETAFEYVEKHMKETGCNDYIRKPIDKKLLNELIKKYFIK